MFAANKCTVILITMDLSIKPFLPQPESLVDTWKAENHLALDFRLFAFVWIQHSKHCAITSRDNLLCVWLLIHITIHSKEYSKLARGLRNSLFQMPLQCQLCSVGHLSADPAVALPDNKPNKLSWCYHSMSCELCDPTDLLPNPVTPRRD